MHRGLKTWLLLLSLVSGLFLAPAVLHAQPASYVDTGSIEDIDAEPEFLDGFVGLGGALIQHMTSSEEGTRQNVRVEFARLRRWISVDARAGFGKDYTDFGMLFRVAKHWRFDGLKATGLSLGVGVGGMYAPGPTPPQGQEREPFVDFIGAPFVRFIWDWGVGVGLGIDLEYQVVPHTAFLEDTDQDQVKDTSSVRQRIFCGVSLLLEVD